MLRTGLPAYNPAMRWPLALADPTTGSVPTRLRKLWRGLTAWGLAAALAGSALGASAPIHIGVLAVLDDEDTLQVWQPLADGLEQALPGRTVRLHALDAAALEAALQQGTLDFVVTNPGHYVLLEARHGATRLATQAVAGNDDSAHAVGSAVVVRARADAPTTLAQLRGARVAAVDEHAFGGYQLAAYAWLQAGVDAEAGALQRTFTGYPMHRVADAVMAGQADAGVLRTCMLELLERTGRVPTGALTVVGIHADAPADCRSSTPLYPGWAFAAPASTPPELGRAVLLALLNLPANQQGSRWSVPANYQRVHEVLRTLQVEPYGFLREARPLAVLGRYWYVGAGVLALVLLGMLYMLHVELLVKRRTAELTRSLHERDRLAQQITQGREAMDHLSRLSILGELSATLGHELSHPLATIANYSASVQRRAKRGDLAPAALEQALQGIAQETERATRVIDGIRALARKRVPQRTPVQPLAVAHEAVALFTGLLRHAPPISVESTPGSASACVLADAQQIQQVLLNLLKNALDAHQAAGLAHAPITLTIDRRGDSVALAVRDQGPPLADTERARLFEPFYTTRPDGLGLGLAICRGIAEAHGGALQAHPADAADGNGMVFELLLPVADPPLVPQTPKPPNPTAP